MRQSSSPTVSKREAWTLQNKADALAKEAAALAAVERSSRGPSSALVTAFRQGEHAAMLAMQKRLEASNATAAGSASVAADASELGDAGIAAELRRLGELLAVAVATEEAAAARDAEARARFQDRQRATAAIRAERRAHRASLTRASLQAKFAAEQVERHVEEAQQKAKARAKAEADKRVAALRAVRAEAALAAAAAQQLSTAAQEALIRARLGVLDTVASGLVRLEASISKARAQKEATESIEKGVALALEDAEAAAAAISTIVKAEAGSAKQGRRADWAVLQQALALMGASLDGARLGGLAAGSRSGPGSAALGALQSAARQAHTLADAIGAMAEADDAAALGATSARAALEARAAAAELRVGELTSSLREAQAHAAIAEHALTMSEAARKKEAKESARREGEAASRRHRIAVAYLEAADEAEATKRAAASAQSKLEGMLASAIEAGKEQKLATCREQGRRMRAEADLEDAKLTEAAVELVGASIGKLMEAFQTMREEKQVQQQESKTEEGTIEANDEKDLKANSSAGSTGAQPAPSSEPSDLDLAQSASSMASLLQWAEDVASLAESAAQKADDDVKQAEQLAGAQSKRAETAEAAAAAAIRERDAATNGQKLARIALGKALDMVEAAEQNEKAYRAQISDSLADAAAEAEELLEMMMARAEAKVEREVLVGLDMACTGLCVAEDQRQRLDELSALGGRLLGTAASNSDLVHRLDEARRQEADEAEARLELAIADHASDVADALWALEKAVSQKEEAVAAFEMSRMQARAQASKTDAVIEQLIEEKLKSNATIKKHEDDVKNKDRQLAQARSQADAARAELTEVALQVAALEAANSDLHSVTELATNVAMERGRLLEETRDQLSVAQSKLAASDEEVKRLQGSLEAMDAEVQRSKDAVKGAERALDAAQSKQDMVGTGANDSKSSAAIALATRDDGAVLQDDIYASVVDANAAVALEEADAAKAARSAAEASLKQAAYDRDAARAEVSRLRERLSIAMRQQQRIRKRLEYAVSQEISQRSAAQGALQAAKAALMKAEQRAEELESQRVEAMHKRSVTTTRPRAVPVAGGDEDGSVAAIEAEGQAGAGGRQ